LNSPSPLLLATSNAHKVGEIRAIFDACSLRDREDAGSAAGVELISLADAGVDVPEPVEDGDTFEANAVIKACYYAAAAKMMCLADDSGLEVDALAGEPGVLSARYAGEEGPRDQVDRANNRLLLERLGDTPVERRTARFVCAMAWCVPGEPLPRAVVRGTVEGRMLTRDEAGPEAFGRGEHGFGYDPLFFIPELGRTTAELSPAEKNAISHRGKAARLMWREFTHR
jgi:XTP/dITP diphosphohydrolase